MDKKLEQTQKLCESRHSCMVLSGTHGKIAGKGKKKIIAICSDIGLTVFDEKKSKELFNFAWVTITSLQISGEIITFEFGNDNKIEFQATTAKAFYDSVNEVLQRILTEEELKRINFQQVTASRKLPTVKSIMARIEGLSQVRKISYQNNIKSKVFDFLFYKREVLNLGEFDEVAPILLYSLPLLNFVTTLKIEGVRNWDAYASLCEIIPQCPFLKKIVASHPANINLQSFREFLTMLSNNENISSLSFGEKSNLTVDTLEDVQKCIVNSNIYNFGLRKVLNNDELLNYFYTVFLNEETSSHIWSLDLKFTKKLSFSALFSRLQNISSLSLENCHFDISLFLRNLCQYELNQLVYLNLSGNKCINNVENKFFLPVSLTHIAVNNVAWSGDSLLSFFTFIFRTIKRAKNRQLEILEDDYNNTMVTNEIYLSIASASTYAKQWSDIFDFLESCKFTNLKLLVWDSNPVDERLMKFLKLQDLKSLSMSGCLNDDDSPLVKLLSSVIKSSKNLEELRITGKDQAFIGSKFQIIVDACRGHPSLKYLDLSHSHCGNQGLSFLIPVLQELNIDYLSIDGVKTDDPIKYIELITTLANVAAGKINQEISNNINEEAVATKKNEKKEEIHIIKLNFPKHDLGDLLTNQLISNQQFFEVRSLFETFQYGIENEIQTNINTNAAGTTNTPNIPMDLFTSSYITNHIPLPFLPSYIDENQHRAILEISTNNIKAREIAINDFEKDYSEEESSNSNYSYSEDSTQASKGNSINIGRESTRAHQTSQNIRSTRDSRKSHSTRTSQSFRGINKNSQNIRSSQASQSTRGSKVSQSTRSARISQSLRDSSRKQTYDEPDEFNTNVLPLQKKELSPRQKAQPKFRSGALSSFSPPVSPKPSAEYERQRLAKTSKEDLEKQRKRKREASRRARTEILKYGLPNLTSQQIEEFIEEYKVEQQIPFPDIDVPVFNDQKWDFIDTEMSLEAMFKGMKDSRQ